MSDLTNLPSSSEPTPATPTPAATPASELQELKATCAALESQTHTLRLVLLVVVVAVSLFFWREAKFNNGLAKQIQPQATQVAQFMANLEKQGTSFEQQLRVLQGAAQKLADYGKTHPDYAPILAKHGIIVGQAAAAPGATNAPARR